MQLESVDLEDNVLPFSLPGGFVSVAVSAKNTEEFREEGGSGSTQVCTRVRARAAREGRPSVHHVARARIIVPTRVVRLLVHSFDCTSNGMQRLVRLGEARASTPCDAAARRTAAWNPARESVACASVPGTQLALPPLPSPSPPYPASTPHPPPNPRAALRPVQDASHYSKQGQAEQDASIDASLMVQAKTWLALAFLFWPKEFRVPTTRLLVRVFFCSLAAFSCQGVGSVIVGALFMVLLAVAGGVARLVGTLGRIGYYAVLQQLWASTAGRFPELEALRRRMQGRYNSDVPPSRAKAHAGAQSMLASRDYGKRMSTIFKRAVAPLPPAPGRGPAAGGRVGAKAAAAAGPAAGGLHFGHKSASASAAAVEAEAEDDPLDGLMGMALSSVRVPGELATGLWRSFVARGHDGLIDKALGWGRGRASISCRKVPMPLPYASAMPLQQQLDTMLMEKLLRARNVHPSVFGAPVMRAMILFKWNYFTRYFILLQARAMRGVCACACVYANMPTHGCCCWWWFDV